LLGGVAVAELDGVALTWVVLAAIDVEPVTSEDGTII
jgi:hypothetical protein